MSGAGPSKSESFSSRSIIEDAVALADPEKNFRIDMPPQSISIRGARAPLSLALRNLVSNAIRHHHAPPGRIRIETTDAPDHVVFSVSDDGPGIATECHDRIFGLFQTLKPSDETGGTGIGLALVKRLIETYGGSIDLESEVGRGTTFRFVWPKRGAPRSMLEHD